MVAPQLLGHGRVIANCRGQVPLCATPTCTWPVHPVAPYPHPQGRGRVIDTLAEIQERHRAVKDLEQSLLELHQMFLDMAVLVEAQGEMLDNIEKQVRQGVGSGCVWRDGVSSGYVLHLPQRWGCSGSFYTTTVPCRRR